MRLTREYNKKYGWVIRLEQANTVYEGIGRTFVEAMNQALLLSTKSIL